jgi:hypothetical protein
VETIVVVAVILFVVAMAVCGISALVSVMRLPDYAFKAAGRSKSGTVVGILLSGGLGGLYYWFSIHRTVTDARKHTPPPPRVDPWSDTKW